METDSPYNIVVNRLKEREKELRCLYQVEEILKNESDPLEVVFQALIEVIPFGWQYPGICEIQFRYENIEVQSEGFRETEWMQKADLVIDYNISGSITLCYTSFIRSLHGSQFLPEEQKLLQLIAERVSASIFFRKLKTSFSFLRMYAEDGKIPGELYPILNNSENMHWKWRLRMALEIASKTDLEKYGIKAMYLIGSAKDATSGPGSDLDLLVHFRGNENQLQLLHAWIEGWSHGLAEYNFAQTGYQIGKMIDLHIIRDQDFRNKNTLASMITSAKGDAMLLKEIP